jgi:hypothetical protein
MNNWPNLIPAILWLVGTIILGFSPMIVVLLVFGVKCS